MPKKKPPALDPDPMLDVPGVAAYTNTSNRTVWRLIKEGALPAVRVRGSVRVASSDLALYLAQQREA